MTDFDFTPTDLDQLFPPDRTNAFFEALFGDPNEGAYDIALTYGGNGGNALEFAFRLTARPGQCLACHLTAGLPEVFRRHPIINLDGLVDAIGRRLGPTVRISDWHLGETDTVDDATHAIPLRLAIAPK